jgi:hypothetical protein
MVDRWRPTRPANWNFAWGGLKDRGRGRVRGRVRLEEEEGEMDEP